MLIRLSDPDLCLLGQQRWRQIHIPFVSAPVNILLPLARVLNHFFSVFVQQKIGKLSAGSFFLVVFGFCSVDDFGTVARAVTVPAHTPVVHAQAVK